MLCPQCKFNCTTELHCSSPTCKWRVCPTCEIVFDKTGRKMKWTHRDLRKPVK